MAYERLKSKPGNMTPGTDGKTLDGFSMTDIQKTIDLLRTEQYRPTPVRRTYIPKKNQKKLRPLGIPSPRDKVVQECIRLILEAIYEPNFHENSHGFRPGRSCHTALESLQRNWTGTKWIINVDISACFDQIDHHNLLDTLREKICDDRFVNLIRKFLTAGYMENWQYHRTYSGTPQGSVISPILTNIYLDKLDRQLDMICQQYSKGKRRRSNPEYTRLQKQRKKWLIQGEEIPSLRESLKNPIQNLNRRIRQTPTYDYNDPSYTRVRFLRYADDVIISVIGPKSLARHIKTELATFLHNDLNLELNQDKTQVVHLATERAHFLGYLIATAHPRFRKRNLQRTGSPHNVIQTIKTTSGKIKLLVPLKKLSQKLKRYMATSQPACVNAFINQPIEHILEHYNGVIRGWYNYYQLAENVSSLHYARYILHYSLAKTLARKENASISKIFSKYGKDIIIEKPNVRQTHFFNQPLRQVKTTQWGMQNPDTIPVWWPRTTQTRLMDTCAICGSSKQVEMHHVRHVRKRGQHIQGFTLYMAAINRKQVPVCKKCHNEIHNGKYDGKSLSEIWDELHVQRA
jgi:group II intron reverse transcriptase/maturase